jgi:uncharacterized protein (TIGR00730 family)
MKRICVFSGSSPGASPDYAAAARELGKELVARKLELVYGGGSVGLMGAVAQVVLQNGGNVIGVIPEALAKAEVAYTDLPDLRIVPSMHARKQLMAELADGFIALPGGLGTFEEFFEVATWTQLEIHAKPCGLLNVNGYYGHLLQFLDHAVAESFIRKEHREMILVEENPGGLLDQLAEFKPPVVDKVSWIKAINKM